MRLKFAVVITKLVAAGDGLAAVDVVSSTTQIITAADLRRFLARFRNRFRRMEDFVRRLLRVCGARTEVCRRPWHEGESLDFRLLQLCLRRSTLLSACIHCLR